MKTVTIVVISLLAMVMMVAIGLVSYRADRIDHRTSYQKCKDTAESLRSDNDAAGMMAAVCDKISYEAGDAK